MASSLIVGYLYRTGNLFQSVLPSGLAGIYAFEKRGALSDEATAAKEGRKGVYTAYISLEVKSISAAMLEIGYLTLRYGGYVAGSSVSTAGERRVGSITIRVPQGRFQQALVEIEGYGTLKDKKTWSDDVAERYIDLKARLTNLERQEARLLNVLQMAKTVDDVLMVERELERVRSEIELMMGRLNYLERVWGWR